LLIARPLSHLVTSEYFWPHAKALGRPGFAGLEIEPLAVRF